MLKASNVSQHPVSKLHLMKGSKCDEKAPLRLRIKEREGAIGLAIERERGED